MKFRIAQLILLLLLIGGCGSGGSGSVVSNPAQLPSASGDIDPVAAALAASPGAADFLSRLEATDISLQSDRSIGQNRFLVFTSTEDLIPTDTNGLTDVYLRDLRKGEMRVVSVSSEGVAGNGASDQGSISDDGRFVVFRSAADNLVPEDTNGVEDVFLHEVASGKTARVSTDSSHGQSNGVSLTPAVSARGRFVVFASAASNLSAGDTNGLQDVFLKDRQSGETVLLSTNAGGTTSADGPSSQPVISGGTEKEGEFIVFCTVATDLLDTPLDGQRQVVRLEREAPLNRILVSQSSGGQQADGPCYSPSVSHDGSQVAFFTLAGNLGSQTDDNNLFDVYLRNVEQNTTQLQSLGSAGVPGNDHSGFPSLSADGSALSFGSLASNLVTNDTNGRFDVFTRTANTTSLTSRSTVGELGSSDSGLPSISASGRYVAFRSASTNFEPLDTFTGFDIYVRDLQTPDTFWASIRCLFAALWAGADGATALAARGPRETQFADLDGDGDLDMVDVNRDGDSFTVYLNIDGLGTYAATGDYPTLDQPLSLDVGDVDGDGDIDVLVRQLNATSVTLFKNLDGRGTFSDGAAVEVGQNCRFARFGDVDKDGDLDIGVAYGPGISILFNTDGDGTFGTPVEYPQFRFSVYLTFGDFDGDGDLDIAAPQLSFTDILLLENIDGDGTYLERPLLDASSRVTLADFGDVDGDRDLDMVCGNNLSDSIGVYINSDGDGTFIEKRLDTNGTPVFPKFGDVDGDGDLDIVISGTGSVGPAVSVMKNDGSGNFAPPVDYELFPTGSSRIQDLGDVDGDGDLDVGVGISGPDVVAVLQNRGGDFQQTVQEFDTGSFPLSVDSADLDGDGDLDLVVGESSSGRLSIYFNTDGLANYTGPVSYDIGLAVSSVCTEDVDSDGDLDLLLADSENDDVVVLTNTDGRGTFVAGSPLAVGDRPFNAISVDLDGDGDNDIATANANDGTTSIFFNLDGAGTYGARQNFAAGSNPTDIQAGDLDGDGDLDLALTDFAGGKVVILSNSDGDFSTATEISVGTNPRALALGDLDSDGSLDIAVVDFAAEELIVLAGDGTGTFTETTRVMTGHSPRAVRLGDVDGDGRLDVVVLNSDNSNISVYLNLDGAGTLDTVVGYATGQTPVGVTLSDVDSDGDLDFLTANRDGQSVTLIRNRACPSKN